MNNVVRWVGEGGDNVPLSISNRVDNREATVFGNSGNDHIAISIS